jgi:hypothetical protein
MAICDKFLFVIIVSPDCCAVGIVLLVVNRVATLQSAGVFDSP